MTDLNTPALDVYERISRRFVSKRTSFFEELENNSGRNSYEALLFQIPTAKPLHVLDIGCGDGNLLKYLNLVSPNRIYTGCDISAPALDAAKKFFPKNADFVNAPAQDLPFANETFDLVFAHMVFALLNPVEKSISEAARVLKNGGEFRIFTPAYWRNGGSEKSARFQKVMDHLSTISPSPSSVGIGNNLFRSEEQIRAILIANFGTDAQITFSASDFEMSQTAEEALQLFSLGMYQFELIPKSEKGNALKSLYELLASLESEDGLVHMSRPMEFIKVIKAK